MIISIYLDNNVQKMTDGDRETLCSRGEVCARALRITVHLADLSDIRLYRAD